MRGPQKTTFLFKSMSYSDSQAVFVNETSRFYIDIKENGFVPKSSI